MLLQTVPSVEFGSDRSSSSSGLESLRYDHEVNVDLEILFPWSSLDLHVQGPVTE